VVLVIFFFFLRQRRRHPHPGASRCRCRCGHLWRHVPGGFSLNNLTLMALTIATGFVVDDAIVMIENISTARGQGHAESRGGRTGAAQILHHHQPHGR